MKLKITLLTVISLLLVAAQMATAETLVVKADRMLDVRSGRLSAPASIVISDGLITAINPATPPADAEIIELGDQTLLPGLMDMHSHLTIDFLPALTG